jgi:hypothetical protein
MQTQAYSPLLPFYAAIVIFVCLNYFWGYVIFCIGKRKILFINEISDMVIFVPVLGWIWRLVSL